MVVFSCLQAAGTALANGRAQGTRAVDRSASIAGTAPHLLQGFEPLKHRLLGHKRIADLARGRRAVLSLDSGLQQHVAKLYERFSVPYGALVALEPGTGRVLAYVSHSNEQGDTADRVRDASAPSASIFKLITAAALVENGVSVTRRTCYHGGLRGLSAEHLADNRARDRKCADLGEALGKSINSVFAKLADRHLGRSTLARYASAFGYGHALPFDVPTRVSRLSLPTDRLELARTAAGFWHSHLSPLHAALIAATIANQGVMPRAYLVERIVDRRGRELFSHAPRPFRSVIGGLAAKQLARMMQRTVVDGTARGAFFDPQGRAFLPGIEVAGKTGSLTSSAPYRAYTWWVGFAPIAAPSVAVAALVINEPRWRVKASYMAREALRYYLVHKPRAAAHASVSAPLDRL
ncbi:MAG: penicillin-binding protein [Proteobacteria bacterium]|nr:penicillin-binding protein [Pseudomonadota bacterium]